MGLLSRHNWPNSLPIAINFRDGLFRRVNERMCLVRLSTPIMFALSTFLRVSGIWRSWLLFDAGAISSADQNSAFITPCRPASL